MRRSTRVKNRDDLMAVFHVDKPHRRRNSPIVRVLWGIAALVVIGSVGLMWGSGGLEGVPPPAVPPMSAWTTYAGVHFTPLPPFPDLQIPTAKVIQVPDFPGAFAIWGAIGRAADGRIWFSAASHDITVEQSAHLFAYDPESDVVTSHGDVLTELRRAGLHRSGEQQVKIHTKIIQGADGYLYFATTDDPADRDTAYPPKWGGHLWRYQPDAVGWEHLQAVDEGFIALVGNGTLLYGLLYPDHVLLQYNISTGMSNRVTVGSVEGHISRHLLCDYKGHAYVPRLRMVRADHAEHTLVEFDANLQQVSEHPLPHYQNRSALESHGIIAYEALADRSIAFTTQTGRLFRLHVSDKGPSRLEDVGWFHEKGQSYASGLFTYSGERFLVGAAEIAGKWDWVCYDLILKRSTVIP